MIWEWLDSIANIGFYSQITIFNVFNVSHIPNTCYGCVRTLATMCACVCVSLLLYIFFSNFICSDLILQINQYLTHFESKSGLNNLWNFQNLVRTQYIDLWNRNDRNIFWPISTEIIASGIKLFKLVGVYSEQQERQRYVW